MRVVLTGASGFLGWHSRARLRALSDADVVPVTRRNWAALPSAVSRADALIHIAGVNRGDSADVEMGNVRLAEDVAAAVRAAPSTPRVVFANSIQSGNGTPYGDGKEQAAKLLREASEAGGGFADVQLPNLFGEHGRPDYNSFVATFIDAVVRGERPSIQDREVRLLHVQDAAQVLIDALEPAAVPQRPDGVSVTVQGVYDRLVEFREVYRGGDVPSLTTKFDVDLFNSFRAALFPEHYPMPLQAHADSRGRLVETVRAHGGQGQTFVSTTRPGVTRGEHFHLNKVERFVVLSGRARISLRRLYHDEVVSFDVSGDAPVVVDMPTMWVHNITNMGEADVTTLFWTESLFDPESPDTYRQTVEPAGEGGA